MRFIDEALIQIHAGNGGAGAISFRREKYIPRGGPDGGDGGRGADITFKATVRMSTLQDFRFKKLYKAPNGLSGAGNNMSGSAGESIVLKIPMGTVLTDADTGEKLFDFTKDGDTWLAAKGGRGGKGNAHFVSSTFQVPRFAQPGEDGSSRKIKLELKLLADAGIIGFPNAGKSTLISRISAARPKVADYPFTTLVPNLGVVALPDGESAVVADIPGLIQGAHKGLGLGHRFLKHIERTRVFIHMIDGTALLDKASDPWIENPEDEAIVEMVRLYRVIRSELEKFNPELLDKPEIVVLSKTDVLDERIVKRALKTLKEKIPSARAILSISAVANQGLDQLLGLLKDELIEAKEEEVRPGLKTETFLPDAVARVLDKE